LANRVLKIDALTLPDHSYLDGSDICYYAGDYTAGENHAFSQTNQLIFNFKKALISVAHLNGNTKKGQL